MAAPIQFNDGFPNDPIQAINFSYFLTPEEKNDWFEWLKTATNEDKVDLVNTLHDIWVDNQKRQEPSMQQQPEQSPQNQPQAPQGFNSQPNFTPQSPVQPNQVQSQTQYTSAIPEAPAPSFGFNPQSPVGFGAPQQTQPSFNQPPQQSSAPQAQPINTAPQPITQQQPVQPQANQFVPQPAINQQTNQAPPRPAPTQEAKKDEFVFKQVDEKVPPKQERPSQPPRDNRTQSNPPRQQDRRDSNQPPRQAQQNNQTRNQDQPNRNPSQQRPNDQRSQSQGRDDNRRDQNKDGVPTESVVQSKFFDLAEIRSKETKSVLSELYDQFNDQKVQQERVVKKLVDTVMGLEEVTNYFDLISERMIAINDAWVKQSKEVTVFKEEVHHTIEDQAIRLDDIQSQLDKAVGDNERMQREIRAFKASVQKEFTELKANYAAAIADVYKGDGGLQEQLSTLSRRIEHLEGGKKYDTGMKFSKKFEVAEGIREENIDRRNNQTKSNTNTAGIAYFKNQVDKTAE